MLMVCKIFPSNVLVFGRGGSANAYRNLLFGVQSELEAEFEDVRNFVFFSGSCSIVVLDYHHRGGKSCCRIEWEIPPSFTLQIVYKAGL